MENEKQQRQSIPHTEMHCSKKRKLMNQVENIYSERLPADDINKSLQHRDKVLDSLPLHFKANSTNLMAKDQLFNGPLRRMKRYRNGEPCNYLRVMEELEVCPKVDLWQILSQTLPAARRGARRFFKLIVSLPAGPVGDNIELQLNRHLLKCPKDKDQGPDQSFYMRAFSQDIALSVVKIRGLDKWSPHLSDANGLVFFAHDQDLVEAKERLQLLTRTSLCPYLALIIERFSCTQMHVQHLIDALQLQELNLKGLKVYKCQKDGLISSLKMGIVFLAHESLNICEELQQVNLSEFLFDQLSTQLFQRIRQDFHLVKLCQKFPQLCQEVYNEAVHRLQLLAEEDLSMMPQLPLELSNYVEPLEDNLNTNYVEQFQHNWHSKESRQIIVQIMEKMKMPTIESMLPPHQWLRDYIKQTQPEDCVDSLIMRSTQRLLYGDGYLDLMQLWVIKRLPYILNEELPQPMSLVYKHSSLRTHFQNYWFFQFVQKTKFKVHMDLMLMPPPPIRPPKEQKPSVDPQEYQIVINRAQKVLNRYYLRRQMNDRSKFLSLVKPHKRLWPTEENELHCPAKRIRRI